MVFYQTVRLHHAGSARRLPPTAAPCRTQVLLLPVPDTPASQPRLNLYFVPVDYAKPTVEPDSLLRLKHLQAARRRKKRTQHLTTLDLFRLDRSTLQYDDTSGKPSSEYNVLLTGDKELSSSPFVVHYSHPLYGGGQRLPPPPTTHTVTIRSVMPGTHFVWSTRPYRVEDRAERRGAVAAEGDDEVGEEGDVRGEGQGRQSKGRGRGRGRSKDRGRGGGHMAEGQGGRGAAKGRGRGKGRARERGKPSGDAVSGSEGSGGSEDEAGGAAAVGRLTLDEDDKLDGFLRDCGCEEAKCGGLRCAVRGGTQSAKRAWGVWAASHPLKPVWSAKAKRMLTVCCATNKQGTLFMICIIKLVRKLPVRCVHSSCRTAHLEC